MMLTNNRPHFDGLAVEGQNQCDLYAYVATSILDTFVVTFANIV